MLPPSLIYDCKIRVLLPLGRSSSYLYYRSLRNPTIFTENENLKWLITWRDQHPIKNSKVAIIEELERYIKTREKEKYFVNNGDDNEFDSKSTKIDTARNLQAYLRGDATKLFTVDQQEALQDGRLRKIYEKLVNQGLALSDDLLEKSSRIKRNPANLRREWYGINK